MHSNSVIRFRWRSILAFLTSLVGIVAEPLLFAQDEMPRSMVATTRFISPSLEGNAAGSSATRRQRVYLPPNYETSNLRYPVLYYLHGGFGSPSNFFGFNGHRTADRLIADGLMKEMIIVGVDGTGGDPRGAAGFVNSELNGNYEDYITQELVEHIDSEFRTIADRNSRGLFGQSMGGWATSIYAMTYSDVFGAAYSLASGFHNFSRPGSFPDLRGEKADLSLRPGALNELRRIEEPSDFQPNNGGLIYAWAGGFSPNLGNLPLRRDYPFDLDSLEVMPEIRDKWYKYDAFLLLEEQADDLASLRGYGFGVGRADRILAANEDFHQALVDKAIAHDYRTFPGGHADNMSTRYETPLTLLSTWLVHFGDFDESGSLDVTDVNMLLREVAAQTHPVKFDLTNNRLVDGEDIESWIKDLKNTWIGDANLDGEFNTKDLVDVFQIGAYEVDTDTGWDGGDWTGDRRFNTKDLVAAFQDGGYERGPVTILSSVPEPIDNLPLLLAAMCCITRCFRANNRVSCN